MPGKLAQKPIIARLLPHKPAREWLIQKASYLFGLTTTIYTLCAPAGALEVSGATQTMNAAWIIPVEMDGALR